MSKINQISRMAAPDTWPVERKGIKYQENINRIDYTNQIAEETKKVVSDLTAKIL